MWDRYWRPYVTVAERRHSARREAARLAKKGHEVSPVTVEGRTIARTFWGKAWCANLESYSDYANRLPRGRAYVRGGLVVDLQVAPGEVTALVSGSSLYHVGVKVAVVPKQVWRSICRDCAGGIDSLVELLQGRFSKGVMERLCRQRTGLFPTPQEIQLSCSCPDWATMCKHVAAVLYGIGARLDEKPELLFRLRQVDETELLGAVGEDLPLAKVRPAAGRVLAEDDLAGLFGVELVTGDTRQPRARARKVASPPAPQRQPMTSAPRAAKPGRQAAEPETRAAKPTPRGKKPATITAKPASRVPGASGVPHAIEPATKPTTHRPAFGRAKKQAPPGIPKAKTGHLSRADQDSLTGPYPKAARAASTPGKKGGSRRDVVPTNPPEPTGPSSRHAEPATTTRAANAVATARKGKGATPGRVALPTEAPEPKPARARNGKKNPRRGHG
jgi:uncharacterized Zn finger protein